jgi:MFS family permease
MGGQSKPEEGAAKKNPLSVLGPAIFLSVFCFASTLPLRPMLLTDVLGDSAAVSSTLARLTASGALSEFIFTPAFGRLMDTYGRKMFLVVALLTSACANGMLFLNSGSLKWWLVEGCVRKAADTVFFTAVRTTLVDCLAHDLPELTISAARMAVFAGRATPSPAHARRALRVLP